MVTDENYLQMTLIGEARGEPVEGIIGVGSVIRNRVLATRKTYKEICIAPMQFSCWNQTDNAELAFMMKLMNDFENGNTIDNTFLIQCIFIGHGIFTGALLDNTSKAKNYVTLSRYQLANQRKDPNLDKWILNLKRSAVLGSQVFLV